MSSNVPVIVPAELNDNYDPDVTLVHDADGHWRWVYNGVTSTEWYNHPSIARLSAPGRVKSGQSITAFGTSMKKETGALSEGQTKTIVS